MNQYNFLLQKNDLSIKKCTIKGKAIIIDTNDGKYVLKEKNNQKLFKYLNSRQFHNFPNIFDYDREKAIYEYIDSIDYDNEEKALDLIRVVALLHKKTSYYKEISSDDFKDMFEKIKSQIDYIYNYYLDTINVIESKVYMSPSEYLLSRNISKVFAAIFYCKEHIDSWFETVKNEKRKRVVTLHNNLDISNLLKNEEIYLISWDSKIDMPIYDLVNFYNKNFLDFDFELLFKEYEQISPLLDSEKELLLILISIPTKLENNKNEYENVKNVRKFLDKIYKTEFILASEKEKETKENS